MIAIAGKVFIKMSLDGYIAREDGDIERLHRYPDTGDDYGFARFMESVDGLVMGRASYETVLDFGDWPDAKPVVVMSAKLTQGDVPKPLRDKVRIVTGTPVEVMQQLAAEGWKAANIDGGKLIQSFLSDRLVSEMTITQIPILLGSGRRLFGGTGGDIQLKLEETRGYSTDFVQLRYRVEQ